MRTKMLAADEILKSGLSQSNAQARLRQHGFNALPQPPPVSLGRRLLEQFRSPLIYILLFALTADLIIWYIAGHAGWPIESFAIALILLLNAGLGVYQERKAETALAHLKTLAQSSTWVIRDGQIMRLPSAEIVPGDLVRIEAGERVPADGRLLESHGITVDESLLTGESLPVEKLQSDELFSATLLARGKGYLEVTRTGAQSAAGNLATIIGGIEAEKTPLEKRLALFAARIARWILLLTGIIVIAGLWVEGFSRIGHVFLFAVALAVAVVPEGLPAVLTLTLALGVERMARKKAVVRKLSAVEALGSVTVIATDKTGTLTENQIEVKDLDSNDNQRALRAMVLANDAEHGIGAGDPLELALLKYASDLGVDPQQMIAAAPRVALLPFDSAHKFMRVTVAEQNERVSYVKGAPEVVLARSRLSAVEQNSWHQKSESYAAAGFRVLALAWRRGEGDDDLIFLGLALLWDPPRTEVPEAIRRAREAGIRVMMVTGDHPATALAVATEVGIPTGRVVTGAELESLSADDLREAVKEANVFARASAEDKLLLVETLKRAGEIVAVTGDGVNDAPALKRSDVGVAMGRRGSDVSREVADLVLLDDNFATIVTAIKEGRNIYENIQKFIRFLFCANLALTLIVVLGSLGALVLNLRDAAGGLLLPLTAMQLLWINVITNGPPALALAFDENQDLMQQPPRDPRSAILDTVSLRYIVIAGAISGLIGGLLLALFPRYGYSLETARTALFLYASISQLLLVYASRRIVTMPRLNFVLHLAVLICLGVQLMTTMFAGLRALLGLESLQFAELGWVMLAVAVSCGAAEVYSQMRPTPVNGTDNSLMKPNLSFIKRIAVAIIGFTVILIGVALLVLPGPGLVTIALGLAILATEFVWARSWLQRAREEIERRNPLKRS